MLRFDGDFSRYPQASAHFGKKLLILSFIEIKALFLKKCATLPSAFSGWVFSDNLARRRFLVLSHL